MRFVITLLALFAFSLHLLLGCCAHHAHGEEGLPGHHHDGHGSNHVHLPAWLCQSTAHDHGHGHSHHESGTHAEHGCDGRNEQSHDSQPTPHLPCMDPDCVFVSAGSCNLLDQCESALALLLPVALVDLCTVKASQAEDGAFLRPFEISPPLRRHLALSRFLN